MEELKTMVPELATAGFALLVIVYKIFRVLKTDKKNDLFTNEQDSFRKMLMDEVKQLKEENESLITEKVELASKLSQVENDLKSLKYNVLVLQRIISGTINDQRILKLITRIFSDIGIADPVSERN